MDNTPNISVRNKVRVQQAHTEQEKRDAFTVRRKVFIDEQQVPAELEYDDHDESSSTAHIVAYNLDTPVGAARLREYVPEVGKAERVAVLQEARGLGIGGGMMNMMEKRAGLESSSFFQLHDRIVCR